MPTADGAGHNQNPGAWSPNIPTDMEISNVVFYLCWSISRADVAYKNQRQWI